jgi:hypothetical protein
LSKCPNDTTPAYYIDKINQICVTSCASTTSFADDSTGECVFHCNNSFADANTYKCVKTCTTGFADNSTNTCVPQCPASP